MYAKLNKMILKGACICSLFLSFLGIACSVGLGETVDTETPTITILTPTSSQVLYGDIEINGTWWDDKSLDRIELYVNDVDTAVQVYPAERGSVCKLVPGEDETWSYTLFTTTSARAAELDSSSILKDGKYEIFVKAYDKVGHNSGLASRTFEVDGTPPVLVLSKPASLVGNSPSSYGRKITITGGISDDHSVNKMNVRIFDEDGNEISLEKSEFTGFDTNDTSVTIAQYYTKDELSKLELNSDDYKIAKNYEAIYGADDSASFDTTKQYTAFVSVTDKGENQSTKAYLRSNLIKLILEACKLDSKDEPATFELKNILTGAYTGDYTKAQQETIKAILEGTYNQYLHLMAGDISKIYDYLIEDTEQNRLTFTVNSKANPTYQIQGYSYKEGDKSSFGKTNKENTIYIRVTPGLDNSPIIPDSLNAKIIKLSAEGLDLRNSHGLVIDENGNDVTQEYVIDVSQDIILDVNGISIKGNETGETEPQTYSINLAEYKEILTAGKCYKVEVSGYDEKGKEFIPANNQTYGFYIEISSSAAKSAFEKNQSYVKASDFDGITTIKITDDAAESVLKVTATTLIFKDIIENTLGTGDFEETEESAALSDSQSVYRYVYTSEAFTGAKKYDVDIDTGFKKFFEGSSAGKNYTIAILVTVEKEDAGTANDVYYLYADNKAPEITLSNKELENKDSDIIIDDSKLDDTSGIFVYPVNGLWSDVDGSGTNEVHYRFENNASDDYMPKKTDEGWAVVDAVGAPKTQTEKKLSSDFTLYHGEGKNKAISFYATDEVGNETEIYVVNNIIFDFEKPVITKSASDSYYEKGSKAEFTFKASDSNELKTVNLTIKKDGTEIPANEYEENGITVERSEIYNPPFNKYDQTLTSAQKEIQKTLSDEKANSTMSIKVTLTTDGSQNGKFDGVYQISAYAVDIANRASDKVEFSNITVDGTAPELSGALIINNADFDENKFYSSTSLAIAGTCDDEVSGVKNIYYYLDYTGREDSVPSDLTARNDGIIPYSSFKTSADGTGKTFSLTTTLFKESKGTCSNTLYIQAEDNAGNLSEKKSFVIKIDSEHPTITSTTPNQYYKNGENPGITFTAKDSNSVKDIVLTIIKDDVEIAADTYAQNGIEFTKNEPEYDDSGNSVMTATLSFASGAADGVYKIKAYAEDIAAQRSVVFVELSTTIDRAAPVFTTGSLKAGGEVWTDESYYEQKNMLISGAFSDNLSNVKYLYYYVKPAAEEGSSTVPAKETMKSLKQGTVSSFETANNFEFTAKNFSENKGEVANTLYIQAEDAAGNLSEISEFKFNIDLAAPVLTSTALEEYYTSGEPVVAYTATDANSVSAINISVYKGSGSTALTQEELAENGITVSDTEFSNENGASAATATVSFNADGNHDGKFTVTAEAVDAAGKSSGVKTFSTTIDATKPEFKDDLKVGNAVWSGNSWYKDTTLKLSGSFTETTSGMDVLYYYVANSSSSKEFSSDADLSATDEDGNIIATGDASFKTGSTQFSFTVEDFTNNSDGKGNNLYVQAFDKAGNHTDVLKFAVNVDTTSPELSSSFYQVGTGTITVAGGIAYVNGTAPVTIYGNYSDEQSGVGKLIFSLAGKTLSDRADSEAGTEAELTVEYSEAPINSKDDTQSLVFKSYSSIEEQKIHSWKAVFTPTTGGKVEVNGSNGTYVAGTNGGTATDTPFTITMDQENPNIKNIRLLIDADADEDAYQNSEGIYFINNKNQNNLTISGVATDNIGVDTVVLAIQKSNNTDSGISIENTGTSAVWKFEHINLEDLESYANATITVVDIAGNKAKESITIKFDTTVPESIHKLDAKNKDLYFRVGDSDNDDISSDTAEGYGLTWDSEGEYTGIDTNVGGKYSEGTYGNANTIKIRGKFQDSESGVKMIYYQVFDVDPSDEQIDEVIALKNIQGYFAPLSKAEKKRVFYNVATGEDDAIGGTKLLSGTPYDKYYMIVETNYNSTLSGFKEGNNFIVIVAEDNVGNVGVSKILVDGIEYRKCTLNVDTEPPKIESASKGQSLVTNGEKSVTISGTVSDNASDVDYVVISISESGIDYSHKATLTKDTSDSNKYLWNIEIPETKFSPISSGNVTVYATATDKAGVGNSQKISAATVIIDKKGPTIKIDSSVIKDADSNTDGIQVNGEIQIKGTASDLNGLRADAEETKTLKLYYTTKSPETDGNGNYTVPDAIEVGTNAEDSSSKWIELASASHDSNWSFTLDTTKISADVESKTAFLIVEGYDAAGNIGYSEPIQIIVDQDTDRPVITITNPSSIEKLATKGSVEWENQTISGTVSDDDNNITYIGYYIGDSVSYDEGDYKPIYIKNGIWKFDIEDDGPQSIFFRIIANGKTYFANDSTTFSAATIFDSTKNRGTYKLTDGTNNYGYRIVTETEYETTKTPLSLIIDTKAPDVETAQFSTDTGGTWQTGIGSQTFGGTSSSIWIRQSAWDANVVKSMEVKVIETTGTEEKVLLDKTYNSPKYVDEKSNGRTYLIFETDEINLSSWTSTKTNENSKRIEITMSDGIKSTITKLDLTVDNTAPKIMFSSPAQDTINSGEITVYGTTDEIGEIYYTVSTDGTTKPSEGELLTSWSGYSVDENGNRTKIEDGSISGTVKTPDYVKIPDAGVSWYVYFDDNQTDSSRAHAVQLKNFATSLGLTNNLSEFTDLVNFYIWIKIVDSVGNSEEYPYLVCVDPQGDRPTVALSSPEKDGESLGGTVKLYGTAEDSNGTVESVWVQLLSAKNGNDYGKVLLNENTISSFVPTTKDLDFWNSNGYTVAKMKKDDDGIHKAWTGTIDSPGSLDDDESVSDYAIKANFTGTAWNLKINGQGEFDPASNATTANDMAVRVYACDNEKNLSYPVTRYFKMDNDTPVISNVMLKQYDSSGEVVIASQEVRTGMYVKGEWYLEFVATDNDEIGSIYLGNSELVDTYITKSGKDTNMESSGDEWTVKKYKLPTDSGVGFFKTTIKVSDKNNHTGTYELEINYDNEAPKLLVDTASDFDIAASVRQNNGFYKLYSKVSDASTTGTPSGVKAIGFYFMHRKSDGEGLVYDPMQKRAEPISTNNLTYADGLYWMSGSVTCDSSGKIILKNDETKENDLYDYKNYVHTGSYIRLDGVMYKIESVDVDGSYVTIAESYPVVTTAQIALAQFVDNRKSEFEADSTKHTDTGYYKSIKNDDGDGMIEELGGTTAQSSWQASIVSRNIPDGPIEIHYTAYDESMNYALGIVGNKPLSTYKTYTTDDAKDLNNKTLSSNGNYDSYVYTYNSEEPAYISNNAPRLAGIQVAIDYTGSGEYEDATKIMRYYSSNTFLIDGKAELRPDAVTDKLVISEESTENGSTSYSGITKIKGKTWIIPEMVGGNGKLWYSYDIYSSGENGIKNEDDKIKTTEDAVYFADGQEDFDTYKVSSGGQSYVNTHKVYKGTTTEYAGFEFDEAFFGTDSSADGYIKNSEIDKPTWFDITIYDSTESSSEEESVDISTLEHNQKAAISVALAVQIHDEINPNVVINPFYWNSATENSLYRNSSANGHIELEDDWKNASGYASVAESGEFDGDPKVSGKIKIEGYAYDNIRLGQLKLYILDCDGNAMFASEDNENLLNGTVVAIYESSWFDSSSTEEISNLTKGKFSDDGWEFIVSDSKEDGSYNGEDGHKVKWTLNLDTSKIKGEAATDVFVKLVAVDKAGKISTDRTKNSESSAEDSEKHNPEYKMDVVPYIAKVYTSLASLKKNNWSVYNRTALGHYPVDSTSSVYLFGFNLGNDNYKPKYNDTELEEPVSGETESSNYPYGSSYSSYKVATLPVENIKTSGEISLTVNGVETLNNKNNNDSYGSAYNSIPSTNNIGSVYKDAKFYNRQPNGDNNNMLTDDVVLDVWQITPQAVKPKDGYATQPVMAINPSSHDIGFAFVNSTLYYSMPNGKDNSYKTWIGGYDFWTSVGFAYDSLGNSYGTAAGGDIADNRADTFRIMTSRWGTSDTTVNGYNNGKNNYRLEYIAQADYDSNGTLTRNFNKERIRSPSLATSNASEDGTTVYLAYYDEINDEIRFKWGTFTNTTQKDWYTNRTTDEQISTFFGDFYGVNKDGYNSESNGKDKLEEKNGDYRLTHNSLIAGQTTDKYTKCKTDGNVGQGTIHSMTTAVMTNEDNPQPVYAGKYVSIAAIENGGDIPDGGSEKDDAVIAVWWDAENSQLLYSYNLSPKSIQVGQYSQADTKWNTPVAIFGEGNGVGEYCKVTVDKNKGVHIAAYDGLSGDLWYAYLSNFQTPSGAKTCIVDSYGIIGTELNIDVALDASGNPVPYISYYAGSCARPKIAYWAGAESIATSSLLESAVNEVFTGAWEVSIVPTSSKVSVDHINVGVWKDSDGKLNWSTNDGNVPDSSNVGTTAPGTNDGKVYGNGSKNPVLGYAITQGSKGYIETAQMK